MASQSQVKILGIVKSEITELGFQTVTRQQWANTGVIAVEIPGKFGEHAKVAYDFQGDRFTLTIYKCVDGRDVGVPSQPPRQGYYDHYLRYSDSQGFETFKKHLRQTLGEIAKRHAVRRPTAPTPAVPAAVPAGKGPRRGTKAAAMMEAGLAAILAQIDPKNPEQELLLRRTYETVRTAMINAHGTK